MDWTLSDYALMLCFGLATFLTFYFALGKPRTWMKDRLGWVLFSYAVNTMFFVGLIAYAIVFEQKVPEPVRFIIGAGMVVALALKIYAIHAERAKGRITHDQANPSGRNTTMTEISPTVDEIKDVSTIWFRTQRALRTAFSTFITILPLAPQVIAIVNGQWESEFLVAVGIQAVALNAVVSRIMAIPTVNAFLAKWLNLGSIPKQNIRAEINPSSGNMVVAVLPDTKALK